MANSNDAATVVDSETIKGFLIAAALQKLEVVRHFIDVEGVHPDATWGGKPTALCYAALKHDLPLMMFLIGRGADVNRRDALGQAPLHYATLSGSECAVAYLIARGAQLNHVNCAGLTALGLAQRSKQLGACYELLRRHGASLREGPALAKCFH